MRSTSTGCARSYGDTLAGIPMERWISAYGFSGKPPQRRSAKSLGVTPFLRHHPGHRLLLVWHAVKASYAPRQPVVLRMEITNVGQVPVYFMDGGHQRGWRNNQFGFTAFGEFALPDIGNPFCQGGIAVLQTLKPGDTFSKDVDITGWFCFDEPGQYRITGFYRYELLQAENGHALMAKPPLWQDFAVGECDVKVEAPAPQPADREGRIDVEIGAWQPRARARVRWP